MNHHLKGRSFITRLQHLNSQECNEEIEWSCSSSDDENKHHRINSKIQYSRKRKRKSSKAFNNISYLDVTIVDSSQEHNKSPILQSRLKTFCNKEKLSTNQETEIDGSMSPILTSQDRARRKSPILAIKSRLNSPQVCKKLFDKSSSVKKKTNQQFPIVKTEQLSDENQNSIEVPYRSKKDLLEKDKTYLRHSLSVESNSQHSISEYESPINSSKTSEEIEIADLTQGLPISIKTQISSPTDKIKKVKYKKDGMAYRLQTLLRKQNANVSLWQHERYLAANSSFVMPNASFKPFQIKRVDFKFGLFLLHAISEANESYFILINSLYVKEIFGSEFILKLYEPYTILVLNKYKVIVNVCRFVCVPFV